MGNKRKKELKKDKEGSGRNGEFKDQSGDHTANVRKK